MTVCLDESIRVFVRVGHGAGRDVDVGAHLVATVCERPTGGESDGVDHGLDDDAGDLVVLEVEDEGEGQGPAGEVAVPGGH